MVMEYVSGGELFDYICKNGKVIIHSSTGNHIVCADARHLVSRFNLLYVADVACFIISGIAVGLVIVGQFLEIQ